MRRLLDVWASAAAAWKNPARSPSLSEPMFGTHDYIAHRAYVMAGRPSWVRFNLRRYFIGTEAPDNGMMPNDAIDSYPDAAQCHCILFDANGAVSRDRGELQARREFDKAVQALQSGSRRLAAFYAGALAHYVGDLAQLCHVMGSQSHWGPEDQMLHANYEVAVERTINFKTRSSSLLDDFIAETDIDGDTPEEIAREVALFTESGENGRHPRWMHDGFALFKKQGIHLQADQWNDDFT